MAQESAKPADELGKRIRAALGEHGEDSGPEDDDDDDEESDMDMDAIPDEEMAKLDQKLAEAFKALGGNKSGAEKKREMLSSLARQHFRLRQGEEPAIEYATYRAPT